MDEETARVGAFLASESVPVLVSIPRPRTITLSPTEAKSERMKFFGPPFLF